MISPRLRWIWRTLLASITCLTTTLGGAEEASTSGAAYRTVRDILYREADETLPEAAAERCRLDLYVPTDRKDFATVVWFHGGGLQGGQRSIPKPLQEQGIAIAAASYRLHPEAQAPTYIQDAAAAVAWTFRHIARYGGSADRIYVSGHSAGGYLTSMIGLDKRWLAAHGIDANRIAGLIPFSGHTITHFTVRAERGIPGHQPIVDDLAPLFHVRPDAPPLLLITGDRNLEMLGRYEENAYLWRMMQVAGHTDTQLLELDGFDHGRMAQPAFQLLLAHLNRAAAKQP